MDLMLDHVRIEGHFEQFFAGRFAQREIILKDRDRTTVETDRNVTFFRHRVTVDFAYSVDLISTGRALVLRRACGLHSAFRFLRSQISKSDTLASRSASL